jgi:hypothetical protein
MKRAEKIGSRTGGPVPDAETRRINAALKRHFEDKEEILLVFVFGSFASGRLTKESDVDVAVLFKERPSFSTMSAFTNEVSGAMGREADLVVLNDSSPIIRMQVLKYGNLISCRDNAILNDFRVRTIKDYDDLKRIRKEAEEKILRGRTYA